MYNTSNSFHEAETSNIWNATRVRAGEQDAAVLAPQHWHCYQAEDTTSFIQTCDTFS